MTISRINITHFCTVPPPEERNKLWMVEAEISPEMMKRKKKKKKRRKEIQPTDPAADERNTSYHRREFGPSAVPRLPKLPGHRSLVANLWEQQQRQQQEQDVLPGAFPEFRPSCPLPYQERYGGLGYHPSNLCNKPSSLPIANPLTLRNGMQDDSGRFQQSSWQPNGVFRHHGQEPRAMDAGRTAVVPRGDGRRGVPIHSRTNLMEAELMDADSDF